MTGYVNISELTGEVYEHSTCFELMGDYNISVGMMGLGVASIFTIVSLGTFFMLEGLIPAHCQIPEAFS
jgi:hypothetical protein